MDSSFRTRDVFQARDKELVLGSYATVPVDSLPAAWLERGGLPCAKGLRPGFHGRPVVETRADAALLLLISSQWPELLDLDAGGAYHVTLSFAFPLWLDDGWRRWTLANLDMVAAGSQLVAVPASDLVAVDPLGATQTVLVRRHRRLLRLHGDTSVHSTANLDAALTHSTC